MPLSIICAGIGAAWIVWQHAQAYLPRMWRSTKNCAGTQSSCSLTSSPMRLRAWPQAQWVASISWWRSTRGRLAGSAWRTAWALARGALGSVWHWAARSSSAVSATMASNSTACVAPSRLSLELPKRQPLSRAISKFSASIWVCLNLISACMRSIRSRISCTGSAAGDTPCWPSGVRVLQVWSMAGSIPRARTRARRDIRQWTNALLQGSNPAHRRALRLP